MSNEAAEPFPRAELAEARELHQRGAFGEAKAAYDRLARRHPQHVELLHLRGSLALQTDCLPDALHLLKRAAVAVPSNYRYRSNFGLALRDDGQIELAMEEMEAALRLKPDTPEILTNLGNLVRDLGLFSEAREYLQRAAALSPLGRECQSNRLFGLLCDDAEDTTAIFAAHREWGQRMQESIGASSFERARDWSPDRRLRVGLVSSDLREHPVAFFLEPLLSGLGAQGFDVYAYSSTRSADDYTRRIRAQCVQWRPVYGVDDVAVAQQISTDDVDVLIDLNGHTLGNRLGVFARRPAPLQVSYLGYPHSTGLPTIDYRISDAWADPEGFDLPGDPVWRLPRCAWCFAANDSEVPASVLPDDNQPVTFGSFNQRGKITPHTVGVWAEILRAVPNSRFVIKAKALRDALARYNLMEAFLLQKVDITRITLLPWTTTRAEHLEQYRQVDIALDTYPYHGTTTTCEALWMGVPVVTRAGTRHASRVGVSLLHACGLDECIAHDDAGFVAAAQALAADPKSLRELRAERRRRLVHSPLMDKVGMARAFGDALREMWRQRCARQLSQS